MIELKNVCKSFENKVVLSNFNYVFDDGSITCVMGASGSGKTTLLNILLGLIKADSGEVSGIPDAISAVFQEDRLCEPYSAVKNVFAVTGNEVGEDEIIAVLGELGLLGSEFVPVSTLSGGMKRRVALARALLAKSELIILDEPFKGLDDETRETVISVLLKYAKGKTLIIATHDERDCVALGAELLQL